VEIVKVVAQISGKHLFSPPYVPYTIGIHVVNREDSKSLTTIGTARATVKFINFMQKDLLMSIPLQPSCKNENY